VRYAGGTHSFRGVVEPDLILTDDTSMIAGGRLTWRQIIVIVRCVYEGNSNWTRCQVLSFDRGKRQEFLPCTGGTNSVRSTLPRKLTVYRPATRSTSMKQKLILICALSLLLAAWMAVPSAAQTSPGEVIFELDPTNLAEAFANPDPQTAAPALRCTRVHWLWPNFCKKSHVTFIMGPLARCSIIWIDWVPYHIRWVFRIFKWDVIIMRPLFNFAGGGNPIGQRWEEVSPNLGRTVEVTGWSDNDGDGVVSVGDGLEFDDGTSTTLEGTGTGFSAVPQEDDIDPDVISPDQ